MSKKKRKQQPETPPEITPADDRQAQRFTRPFLFAIGPDDRARKMDEARAAQSVIDATDGEIASLMGSVKALRKRVQTLEAERNGLIRSSGDGSEEREVECERRAHPTRPVWQLVRLDTGDVFSEVEMTDAERQQEMPVAASDGDTGTPLPEARGLHAPGSSTVVDAEAVPAGGDEDRASDDGEAVAAVLRPGADGLVLLVDGAEHPVVLELLQKGRDGVRLTSAHSSVQAPTEREACDRLAALIRERDTAVAAPRRTGRRRAEHAAAGVDG